MLQFPNNLRVDLFKTLSTIYHKLHITYHELLTNLMIYRIIFYLLQLKNNETARRFPCFTNKMFKLPSNFMSKVLKMTNLHQYHFFTYFTSLFYALPVQIRRIRNNCSTSNINLRNMKHIHSDVKLKYIVDNNVIELQK